MPGTSHEPNGVPVNHASDIPMVPVSRPIPP